MGHTRRPQAPADRTAEGRTTAGEGPAAEERRCEACGKTVPRLQAARCASCQRTFCRLCVRWYGHFMLVCEDCRAGDW